MLHAFCSYTDIIGLSGLETVFDKFSVNDEYFFWFFEEDKYNPGTFYCSLTSALYKYDMKTESFTLLTGDPLVRDYHPGPEAKKARYNLIEGAYQFNETRLILNDFVNGCYRVLDLDTNLVTRFLSFCSSTAKTIDPVNPGVTYNGTYPFLGLSDPIYIQEGDFFLVRDMVHSEIFKFDANKNEVTVFITAERMRANFITVQHWLLNGDGSKLYISHSNGISTIDLETREVELLMGKIERNERGVPSDISNGNVGFQDKLMWIIPDLVLAGFSQLNDAISIIDLKNRQASHLCVGKYHIGVTLF